MYIVSFYFLIFLVILVIADIFYVSIIFSQNKVGSVLALHLLRSVVSYIVTVLFLPIVEFFVLVLECTNEDPDGNKLDYYYNSNLPELRCWEGTHYIHAMFAILTSVIFCIICAVVQTIFYETKTNKNAQNPKTNSKADLFGLVVKILYIITYSFLVRYKNLHWVTIIITFILALGFFIIYWIEKPFFDVRVMKGNLLYTGIYLWNTAVLLIGKILETSEFDGCIELFFAGVPIVFIIIWTMKDDNFSVLLMNINKVEKGEIITKQVRFFLELIDDDKDRRKKVMLKGYIKLHIESCPQEDCALKKYIASHSSANPDGIISYLYLHAQSMYQAGISKFPNCTSLRMAYSFFLMERLNNKKLSLLQLKTAEKYEPTFEEQFLIYNFKKIIEEKENDGDDEEDEGELDVVSNIAYRNHYVQFKNAIVNAASLYTDFWNLLLIPNQDTQEDLTKMNEIGSKINGAVEVITTNFEMMLKYKSNDEEALRMYTDFLTEILNDKEKAAIYKNKLSELEKDKNLNVEIQNTNFDVKNLPTNDEFQYIILSAEQNHIGLITKVSTGICSIFGYTKSEIIGKNLEAIMPDLYHKHHRNILQNSINEYKKNFGKNLNKKPTFREISVFCKNHSKFLVQLDLKVALLANQDQSEIYFIAKVNPDSTLYHLNSKKSNNICYILTNKKFIVQNFTVNSINILGLQSSSMGTMDLSKMIKDFTDDNLDGEEKENHHKGRFDVINKYRTPTNIVWRTLILDKSQMDLKRRTLKDTNKNLTVNSIFNKTPIMRNRYKEDNYIMTVSESRISGHIVGFIFKFESLKYTKITNANPSLDNLSTYKSEMSESISINRLSSKFDTYKSPKLTSTSNINNNGNVIDNDFFPNNPITFYFDQQDMSYITNNNHISKIKHNLKEEAEKKLEKFQILKNDENREDGLSSEGSDQSLESQSSNVNDYTRSVVDEEVENTNQSIAQNDVTQYTNEYYQVDMSSIIFLIYDHKKNTIVEIKDKNRQSQVEFKKYEDSKKMEKLSLIKKQTEKKRKESGLMLEENLAEENNITNNETILLKQIEYALGKEESQPEIIKLKSISFLIFFIIILINILFFVYFLINTNQISNTLDLIDNSYKLISNSLTGVYFIRELLLINNPTYNMFIFDSKDEYKKNITDSLLNIFNEAYVLQNDILKSNGVLRRSIHLDHQTNYNEDVYITVINDLMETKTINLSLETAYAEANTALYNIINLPKEEMANYNKFVFFYYYNWLNSLLLQSYSNAYAYVSEIKHYRSIVINQFNFILIAFSLTTVIIFFYIKKAYNSVLIRKESYLEVFFEIGIDVIKRAIEKCDKFSKKFSTEEGSDANSTILDEELEKEEKEENIKQNVNNHTATNQKIRKVGGGYSKMTTFKMIMSLLMIILFFVFIDVYYGSYLDTLNGYCSFYNVTASEESYYLLTFNILREFFFDKNSEVLNITASNKIEEIIENNYDWDWSRKELADEYLRTLPESFTSFYNEILYSDICKNAGDLFSNHLIKKNIECGSFLSNSTSYGLDILITNYIEDIRTLKFKFDKIYESLSNRKSKTFVNKIYSSFSDMNEEGENNLFMIFNDQLLFDIGLMNVYIIRNSYNQTLSNLKTAMDDSLDNYKLLFTILFILFFILSLYGYFLVWKPFENHLKQTVL